MDIQPGELKELTVEVGDNSKTALIEVLWRCEYCDHNHTMLKKLYLKDLYSNIAIACPCCTPLWMKIRNWFRWRRYK